MSDPQPNHRFDHVVVAMFENRSFDNLLGYLYGPGEVASFEGLAGRDLSNPIPDYAPDADRRTVPVHASDVMDSPDPDPGEEHPHTNTQLFGTVRPDGNRFVSAGKMQPPFNAPADPNSVPTMTGFVTDYINSFRAEAGRFPRYDEYAQIMSSHTPAEIPVLSGLAREFACFDRWFCEVPSQTFPNRSFFHAASSSGFVVNEPFGNFPLRNDAETIFERLEAAHVTWKVYFDPIQLVSLTGIIHARRLFPFFRTHFSPMDEFFRDAASGKLPGYSFIEPSLIPPHSDMHPPVTARLRRILFFLPRPSAIAGGESLLAQIYNSIRTSATPGGSNYQNTLFLVTFDEHGGTYDHVPPPRVPPPDPAAPAGQMGFRFDRAGVRIPTVAISAWIDRRTVVSREYRSTSVIRTLRERWSLGPPLSGRDADAADIAPLLTRSTPRPPEDWPTFNVPPPRRKPTFIESFLRPLPPLGQHIFAAALAHEESKTGVKSTIDLGRASHWRARRHLRRLQHTSFPQVTRRRSPGP
jgi:phospholipase C